MAAVHNFVDLPLLLRQRGKARLRGGGAPAPQTVANRNARAAHSETLRGAAQTVSTASSESQVEREALALTVIQHGIPVLVQVDPGLELDALRDKFSFEIVAEQEEG